MFLRCDLKKLRPQKQDLLAGVTSNFAYDPIYELTQVMQGTNTTESYSATIRWAIASHR